MRRAEEQRRLRQADLAFGRGMERAKDTEFLLRAELEEALAKCEALQAKVEQPITLERMLAEVPKLSGEDEGALSLALLERARAGEAQPTLPHLKRAEQRAVLRGMLDALPNTMKVELTVATLGAAFSEAQRTLIVRETLQALSAEQVAEAIAPLFTVTRSESVSPQFLVEAANRRRELVNALMAKLGAIDRTAPELWAAFRPPQSKLRKTLEEREKKIHHLAMALKTLKEELEMALQLNASMQQLQKAVESRYNTLEQAVLAEASAEHATFANTAAAEDPHPLPAVAEEASAREPERPSSAPAQPASRSGLVAATRIAVSSNRAYRAQLQLEREREARLQQMLELQAAAASDADALKQQRAAQEAQLLAAQQKISLLETLLT